MRDQSNDDDDGGVKQVDEQKTSKHCGKIRKNETAEEGKREKKERRGERRTKERARKGGDCVGNGRAKGATRGKEGLFSVSSL